MKTRWRLFSRTCITSIPPCPSKSDPIRGPLDTPVVQTDDRQGAYAATRHLLELGHEHIMQLVPQGYQPMAGDLFDRRLQGIHARLSGV